MNFLNKLFGERINKNEELFIKKINVLKEDLCDYSPIDIIKSLFVLSIWLPNVSCQGRLLLLTTVFSSIPLKEFKKRKCINDYTDFKIFFETIEPNIPILNPIDNYCPEPDWGQVKYSLNGDNYSILYGGEIENIYDYLKLFEMIHCSIDHTYKAFLDKSPLSELKEILKLQDLLISNVACQPKVDKGQDIVYGHCELPSEAYWNNTWNLIDIIRSNVQEENLSMDQFCVELGTENGQIQSYDKFVESALSGKILNYLFINIDGNNYPILPRRFNAILIETWSYNYIKLLKISNINEKELSDQIGISFYRYLNDRVNAKKITPPVSVLDGKNIPLSIKFSASLLTPNRLVLFFIDTPLSEPNEIGKRLELITGPINESLLNLKNCGIRFALYSKEGISEIVLGEGKNKKIITVIVAIPQLFTSAASFRIPDKFNGEVMFLDQLIGIIDEQENSDEIGAYLDFMEHTSASVIKGPSSMLDQFASFKDSYGILIEGALQPDGVFLDPNWGSYKRFDTLSKFWTVFPKHSIYGDPRRWKVVEESTSALRLESRSHFESYRCVEMVNATIFITAPFEEMNYEQAKLSDFMTHCIQDGLIVNKRYLNNVSIFEKSSRIIVTVYPYSLIISNKAFEFLRSKVDDNNIWSCNSGWPNRNTPGARVLFSEEGITDYFSQSIDRRCEIELLKLVIQKLDILSPTDSLSEILDGLDKEKQGKKRFYLSSIQKEVSFPELAREIIPDTIHFKKARKIIAELSFEIGIEPGEYSLEPAKVIVNKLRDAVVNHINKEIKEYNYQLSLPLLLHGVDALIQENDDQKRMINTSLDHEVDYSRKEKLAQGQHDFRALHKNYRYLIEKFNQLSPNKFKILTDEDIKYLLALVDWLIVLYSASDSIYYDLMPTGIIIDADYKIEVKYNLDLVKMEKDYSEFEANIAIGITGNQNDRVNARKNPEEYLNDLNAAFKQDLGFGIRDVVSLLVILSQWGYRKNNDEKTSYSAGIEELTEAFKHDVIDADASTIPKILDFLTLKQEEMLIVINQVEECNDLPLWEHRKRPSRYTLKPLIYLSGNYYWGPYSVKKVSSVWQNALSDCRLPVDLKAKAINEVIRRERELTNKALEDKSFEIASRFTTNIEKNLFLHKRDENSGHPVVLGDYDVIAFIPKVDLVLIIECKDLYPPYCAKDAKRLREKIFGNMKTDLGYFNQIIKRKKYLTDHIQEIGKVLNWDIKKGKNIRIKSIFVSRVNFWWTMYPPIDVETSFCRIDLLSEVIQDVMTE